MGCPKLHNETTPTLRLAYSIKGQKPLKIACSCYPFGLQHKGYNTEITGNGNSLAQQFKYQGQELSEDLGLNMYEFKYRFYDAAIGRFWSIDPLANIYVYNSTYAFQENKLGLGSEFEGKEIHLHDWLVREGSTAVAKELDKRMEEVGMNKMEKSVASKNLYNMYKLQQSNNKNKAEKFTIGSGLKGRHNGEGDAFRHGLFNALNTQTVGNDLTERLGDAHEDGDTTQPDNEKTMDKVNNTIGRDLAKDNPDATILELATMLLDKLEDGEMATLNAKGNIVKSKLTKSERADAEKKIKKLDEDEKAKKKYN
ncbi:DUF6973 domain-containing protein [Gelidibacter japonicus]|uniref:DUF6973 domain-containing protein n=1 Tax=Gelidibacter japonicus TaxID=1962232 RepID=UPI003A954566